MVIGIVELPLLLPYFFKKNIKKKPRKALSYEYKVEEVECSQRGLGLQKVGNHLIIR